MYSLLPFGRIAALFVCVLLSACAASAPFGASAAMSRPSPALGAFLAARYAESIGDSENAARFYRQALQADPDNKNLLQVGFLAGLLAGDPETVSMASRLPGDVLASLLRGNEAVMNGNYGAAITIFKTLPDNDLSIFIQPLLLAWAEFGQGHEQRAQQILKASFGNEAFGGVYRLNAAMIADAAGNTSLAAQLYGTVGDASSNLRVTQILASWYARQGDKTRANEILVAFTRLHPELALALPRMRAQMDQPVIATPQQGVAEAYMAMAASLSQPQTLFLRIVFLRFALALQPDFSVARMALASGLLGAEISHYQPTSAQITAALAVLAPIAPQDLLYSVAVVQEAALNAALGQTSAAVALLDRLIALHPQDPWLLAGAGDLWRHAGQCGLALPYYQKAIALVGAPPPASAWSLFFDRGICEDEQGSWAKAEPDIQLALKLSPDQPYVLNYLAYRWAQQGKNLNQAQQMLLRAVALAPNDGGLLDSLGFVELKRGNMSQALALLISAVQLAPANPEVNAHLGDAFYQSGHRLQAVYQWDRALSLHPDAELKARLTNQIQKAIQAMTP